MNEITKSITFLKEYKQLKQAVDEGKTPVLAVGLSVIHKAHLAAALGLDTGRPVLVLTDDDNAANRFAADLRGFSERDVVQLPSRELVMADVVGVSRGYEQRRLAALDELTEAHFAVASVQAAAQRTMPPEALKAAIASLATGETAPLDELAQSLTRAGYERCVQVEGTGQFSIRGGILDVFPPQAEHPYRVEFWDDEIDSISTFDVGSQRRLEQCECLRCLPCMESIPALAKGGAEGLAKAVLALTSTRRKKQHADLQTNLERDAERLRETGSLPAADKYMPLIYPQMATAFDYLPENAIVIIEDTPRLRDAVRDFHARVADDVTALLERGEMPPNLGEYALDFVGVCSVKRQILRLDSFLNNVAELTPQHLENFIANQMNAYGGNLDMASADIRSYTEQGRAVAVVCGSTLRCQNMLDALTDTGLNVKISDLLPKGGCVNIMEGTLSAGFEYPDLGLVVMTEGQVLARRKKTQVKKSNRDKVKSYTDLTPGDLVVHEHHGIGRFIGMERMTVDGSERDFIKIAFAGTDFLYVPATSLDLISKYIGGGDNERVRLNKLGGADWSKAKARAKAAAKELAEGLIKLYAERAKVKGYAFPPDDAWQREFEEDFPYEETDDQLRCIAEIKDDMQSDRPMDRLLCGDVGVGKTEVALRAAFKCIMGGKQVAVLVPTTILAWQHYTTILSRMEAFPVKAGLLSRFASARQQKETIKGLAAGTVDVVVGTHRMLQKDVKFHDLGLVIIDEEQRFGVKHKEKLKENFIGVDMLTLSATPIPRTLNMAMSGLRDMSTIEEPPFERRPIETYVMEYDAGVVAEALRRELDRGGQAYYIHNRIDTIDQCAAKLAELLPGARIATAHGRMDEATLSGVWQKLLDGEIDVLVCTTLIETGVDVRNCNTLIIEDADRMGLAQLYQIRGRVGRSGRKAYAYFTFRRDKVLTDIAAKRLSAIREFTSFGSGFRIAMRDLQIRGAGNLLGQSQHGHMEAVGYEMYVKLLNQAIAAEKGEAVQADKSDCLIDITVDAYIPEKYIPDAAGRIEAYKRIAAIDDRPGADDVLDELADRYGPVPKSVQGLIDISLVRVVAAKLGIYEITQNRDTLILYSDKLDLATLKPLLKDMGRRLLVNASGKPYLSVRILPGEKPLDVMNAVFDKMAELERPQ